MVIAVCLCFLALPVLTACSKPSFLGVYSLWLPGVQADVTDMYREATIEIDEANEEITFIMLGNSDVYEYDLHEFDVSEMFVIYHDPDEDNMVVTAIVITRFEGRLIVTYSHIVQTPGEELELALEMEFEHASSNLYTLDSAIDVSEAGLISFEFKKGGDVVVTESSNALGTISVSNGTFTVTNNTISVDYDGLTFVGTIIDNNKIEIDLTDNADFAMMLSAKHVDIELDLGILSLIKSV